MSCKIFVQKLKLDFYEIYFRCLIIFKKKIVLKFDIFINDQQ